MVAFSPEAVADLRAIRDYIGQDSPARAAKIAAMITTKCRLLDRVPRAGRPGRVPGTRELSTASPWVIVYELTATGPYILRVWHARQSRAPSA